MRMWQIGFDIALFYQNFEIKFYISYFCFTIFYGSEIISIGKKPKRLNLSHLSLFHSGVIHTSRFACKTPGKINEYI